MKTSKLLTISMITTLAVAPYAYAEYSSSSTTKPTDTSTNTTVTTTTALPDTASSSDATNGSTTPSHNVLLSSHGTVPDSTIESNIKDKISANSDLSKLDTRVISTDGKVMLEGNTDTHEQTAVLAQLAQSTHGVKDVDTTKLTVKNENHSSNTNGNLGYSDSNFADSIITAKIKGLYVREELFGKKETAPMTIHVETKDGNVILTGLAKDSHQAERAVSLAQSVSGVKDVKSSVTVNGGTVA